MKFLVVEDEYHVAEVLRRSLESLGNSCVMVSDARLADEVLGEQEIDALTVDLGIPGIGGLDWLESVAAERPDLARKTLIITGSLLEPESVERVARCGAGVLAKPFTMETLREALRVQIEHDLNDRGN